MEKYIETQRVPVKEAAQEIGVTEAYLRQQMRRGVWDLGQVTPPPKGSRGNIRYLVFRVKLDRFLGVKNDEDNQDNFKDDYSYHGRYLDYRRMPARH